MLPVIYLQDHLAANSIGTQPQINARCSSWADGRASSNWRTYHYSILRSLTTFTTLDASWKAGMLLPLSSRLWSLNCYSFSKLWYKTSCLDIRAGDTDAITSSAKGWLYQDMLIKSQEMMLYRSPDFERLGLFNVKSRSMAILIHNFLLQAVCPMFPTNYYLNTLFRWHVLDDRTVAEPGRPPY